MRFKKFSTALTVLTLAAFLILLCNLDFANKYHKASVYQRKYSKCKVVHIGVVCIGTKNNFYFYTLLKSLFFYRTTPLHFHVIVDDVAETTMKTLFETWAVPQVDVNFYNINGSTFSQKWILEYPALRKLTFPAIIPIILTNKIIVIDPDLIFASNVHDLWNLLNNFQNKQFIGLPERISDLHTSSENGFGTNIILYHLDRMQKVDWDKLWVKTAEEYTARLEEMKLADQVVVNEVVKKNLDRVYRLPCQWNLQRNSITNNCSNDNNQVKLIHWNASNNLNLSDGTEPRNGLKTTFTEYDGNLLRWQLQECTVNLNNTVLLRPVPKSCISFPEAQLYKRRTLLFFREFKYTPAKYDVTFVTQLSYDKLQILNEVGRRWQGPMSLSFYVTDSELQECINFIEKSAVLKNRFNIAYHAIFKEGNNHPINALRNIALGQVVTPYVFLNDMDLVPMQDVYFNIKTYIFEMKTMEKKALVVPAFETKTPESKIPTNKEELLKMMDNKVISVMEHLKRPQAHGPTNNEKWRIAETPYSVKWKPKYEPYVVVQRNVTKYDERFFAYGWDKISHIMELEAQGYEFLVLPEAFVVHKAHPKGKDKKQFSSSRKYKACLKDLKYKSAKDLSKKYGRKFYIS